MLNISENRVNIEENDYQAFSEVTNPYKTRAFAMWLLVIIAVVIVFLFLPWTQNIQIDGRVTSLHPSERPQTVQAIIPGIIQEWFISEGDTVRKGDTLVRLSESKKDYFDDNLLDRLREQLYVKKESVEAYKAKIRTLLVQKKAIENIQKFKYSQVVNKIKQKQLKVASDSGKVVSAQAAYDIAIIQYANTKKMYEAEVKSLSDLQGKQQKLQEKQAKLISVQNNYEISQNELLNTRIQLISIEYEYTEKISKVQTYMLGAKSDLNSALAEVSKLQNKVDGNTIRKGFLYITAPQQGYITKALQVGLGETVKAGTAIVSIMPKKHQLAAELYVSPVDLPLIGLKHQVRLIFDGAPTFVLSGWPDASFGTFSGEIVAVDNMISENGKFRILVSPIEDDSDTGGPWPIQLRIGSGCKGMALLNDVPVWKEIWRQLNGFPQDFYDDHKNHPYVHDKKKAKEKKKSKK